MFAVRDSAILREACHFEQMKSRQSSRSSGWGMILLCFILAQTCFYLAYVQYKSSAKVTKLTKLYNTCIDRLKDVKRKESDKKSGSKVVDGIPVSMAEKELKLQLDTQKEELALFKRRYNSMMERVKTLQARVDAAKGAEQQLHMAQMFPKMVQTDLAILEAIYGKDTNEVTVRITVAGIQIRLLVNIRAMPHTSRFFLNLIEAGFWNGCHLVRDGGHVLQFNCGSKHPGYYPSIGFQEYNEQFPHIPYTIGFGGRPGGPDWYISMVDNTQNHGPGGQPGTNEADPCFGRVHKDDIQKVLAVRKKIVPGDDKAMGFLNRDDMLLIEEAIVIKE